MRKDSLPVHRASFAAERLSPAQDFDDLYEKEFPQLTGVLYAMGSSRPLAEDVAQDAFAHAWARWARVSTSPSPVGWIYTTAFRMLRRRIVVHRRPPAAVREDTADPWSAHAQQLDLLEAVRALPGVQRRVVVLRHVAGFSTVEVAERLGISEGAVRARLHRAVVALRNDLDPTKRNKDA